MLLGVHDAYRSLWLGSREPAAARATLPWLFSSVLRRVLMWKHTHAPACPCLCSLDTNACARNTPRNTPQILILQPATPFPTFMLFPLYLLPPLLLPRLYDMGLISTKKSLVQVEKLATSAFCRRRLAVVMVRSKMCETVKEAATFVEQGHVRVGPNTVTDPAFLVTRGMEDFVTWVDTSKIKRKIMRYNDALDDYDLLS